MIVAIEIGGDSERFCEADTVGVRVSRCCKQRQGVMELS
jgi:hypothetical protein